MCLFFTLKPCLCASSRRPHLFLKQNVSHTLHMEQIPGKRFPLSLINTSYQKLPVPFGSGDYPDKLLFHQALN